MKGDVFEGMAVGEDVFPAVAFEEVGEILKKVGLISVGSIGGAMIRDQVLVGVLKDPLWATVAEAGVGVVGAAVALNQRSDLLFWPLVGIGVHGVTDLLRQLLGTTGLVPAA